MDLNQDIFPVPLNACALTPGGALTLYFGADRRRAFFGRQEC